jgi:transposase
MKEWNVIHQIKALYNEGNGLSERKIAKQLGISRHTVSKYLKLTAADITAMQVSTDRNKKLDDYREYIIHLLQTYPGLSAVKVLRKLKAKEETLAVSERSVRRYIQALKQEISVKQQRYYEPVLDMVPGEQCQVDGGELRGVMIGGVETTVYFMVFVLSYSRLMHVSVSDRPIDTETLIRQHDAAFRYFGGMPAECVYDQTKLVVISEVFRELELNQRFHQYATAAGFHIHACEGYDPESKGKVEAGVKYVKQNGFYGETFGHWSDLETYLSDWLDTIANQRIHGSTGQQPALHYRHEEQAKMLPYLTPSCVSENPAQAKTTRKVDKTGLIAWQGNQYSVPMAYQRAQVGVTFEHGQLRITDLSTGQKIAEHTLRLEKGQIIKNTGHYRDKGQYILQLEQDIQELLGKGADASQALCALLKQTSPKIYKDQLLGVKKILNQWLGQYGPVKDKALTRILKRSQLTATGFRACLEAWQYHLERTAAEETTTEATTSPRAATKLARYRALNGQPSGQGGRHAIH